MLWKAGCPGATPQSARPGHLIRIESVGAVEARFAVILSRPWGGVSTPVSREGLCTPPLNCASLSREGAPDPRARPEREGGPAACLTSALGSRGKGRGDAL